MSMTLVLLVVAVCIILILSAIAGRLVYRVYRMQKANVEKLREQQLANEQSIREQRERTNKSIQIIAMAVQQDELTLTEACMRIAGLLDHLDVDDGIRQEFSAFYQLRDLTQHIPILEEWQKLDRKQQNDFDIERLRHEATYNDFVIDAAKRILGRNF